MSSATTGLPLLSGVPPPNNETTTAASSCRKCDKEFNVIFTRSKMCHHCGYAYCSTCSNFTGLLPRSYPNSGFDPSPVCAYCIDNLYITAKGKGQLKDLSLARLKRYAEDYGIKTDVVEKNELIDNIMAARGNNGCLQAQHEAFYRKWSVPNNATPHRTLLSMIQDPSTISNSRPPPPTNPASRPAPARTEFARPDLAPDVPFQASRPFARPDLESGNRPPNGTPPQATPRRPANPPPVQGYRPIYVNPNPHQTQPHPHLNAHMHNATQAPPRPSSANHHRPPQAQPMHPPQTRTRATSSTARPANAPAAPTPTLDALLAMPQGSISTLSISTLKAILYDNHVNAGQILEKADLVAKVKQLVDDERSERERKAREEEEEKIEEQRCLLEAHRARQEAEQRQRKQAGDSGDANSSVPSAETRAHKPSPSAMTAEKNGLCVVCQDEDANIAIVDCGHLAMCRACSDLIMGSTRECPLCRTRIVTPQRLLRIYRS